MAGKREKLPVDVETKLLVESRRRCCLCACLHEDWKEKTIQLAHINRNRADNRYENLAVLCLFHHDAYDSRTSQSKQLTPGELRVYKKKLIEKVADSVTGNAIREKASTPMGINASSVILTFSKSEVQALEIVKTLQEAGKVDPRITPRGKALLEGALHDGHRILKIADQDEFRWQIFLLEKQDESLRIVNDFYVEGQRGHEPEIRVIPGNSGYLVIIDQLTHYGTGVRCVSSLWYLVGKEHKSPILRFPIDGYVTGWGMPFQRHITGKNEMLPPTLSDGAKASIAIKVEYKADVSLPAFGEVSLFSTQQRLVIVWDSAHELFLPSFESNTTEAEVSSIFEEDFDQFMDKHRPIVESLSRMGDQKQREWADFCLKRKGRSN